MNSEFRCFSKKRSGFQVTKNLAVLFLRSSTILQGAPMKMLEKTKNDEGNRLKSSTFTLLVHDI